MKAFGSLLICALVVASSGAAFAQTEILTFDDLNYVYNANGNPVPNGYGGLQWQNVDYDDVRTDLPHGYTGPSGYKNGIKSPYNVIYNGFGNPALISGGSFNFNSAYLTAAWNDGLQVEAQGLAGGTLIYDNTYTVNTASPTLVTFNYLGIDEVNLISSGGVHNPAFLAFGTQFAMDNLSITLVPEPSTVGLLGLAVLLLVAPRWQACLKRSYL